MDAGSSYEGHCLPRIHEIFYVTILAFARSDALQQFMLTEDKEYVLQATVVQVSKKRIDLTFTYLAGLKVSWPLHTFVAFCHPLIKGNQRHLDDKLLDAFPGLAVALGAHKPSKPATIASTQLPQRVTTEDEQWEAKLLDGAWHSIVIQQRFAKHLLAYCPDIDEDVDIPLSRVRRATTISANKRKKLT